jgi:hypothetical protein
MKGKANKKYLFDKQNILIISFGFALIKRKFRQKGLLEPVGKT